MFIRLKRRSGGRRRRRGADTEALNLLEGEKNILRPENSPVISTHSTGNPVGAKWKFGNSRI
jgi:hypothetical protein